MAVGYRLSAISKEAFDLIRGNPQKYPSKDPKQNTSFTDG